MKAFTKKGEIQKAVEQALREYSIKNPERFIKTFYKLILTKKIKFPLLELAASQIHEAIPSNHQLPITNQLINLNALGSFVITGKILQLRLSTDFKESIESAKKYIIQGDEWYVCDIIGERVIGQALLTFPKKIFPTLKKLAKHDNKWIVRSVGVASHYAIKKGLEKQFIEPLFQLLFSLATTTDFHTKKGIGWAVKTMGKFHPDIIKKHQQKIIENPEIKQWFKTKIKIGLERNNYAKRNSSKVSTQ